MAKKNELMSIEVGSFAKTVTPLPIERPNGGSGSRILWGDSDNYPNFLLKLYDNVPLHQSIVNSKVDYLLGDGMVSKATKLPVVKKISNAESNDEFANKIVYDYVMFGWLIVAVQYNIYGKPVAVYHVPANLIRTNEALSKFWFCKDWETSSVRQLSFDSFKPGVIGDPHTKIYAYKAYVPSVSRTYPKVKYGSAIINMVTEMIINDFGKNNLEEGFSAAHIISFFKGLGTTDQAQKFTDKVKKAYSGQAGAKFIIDFNNPPTSQNPASPVTVTTVDSPDYSAKLEGINKKNETNILSAHQAPSRALFGIEQAAGLNGNDLENAYTIFKQVYVKNNRNSIEAGINALFTAIGIEEIEFKDNGAIIPVTLSDAVREKVLTINELRSLDNKEPRPDGDKLIEVVSPNSINLNTGDATKDTDKRLIEVLGIGGVQALQGILSDASTTPEQKKNSLIIIFGLTPEDAALLAGITTGTITPFSIEKPKGRILTEMDFDAVKDLGMSKNDFSVLDESDFHIKTPEDFRRVELLFDDAADVDDWLTNNDIESMSNSEIRAAIRKDLGIALTTSELTVKIQRLTDAKVIGDKPEKKSVTRDVKVLYEYDVKPGFGEKIIKTSRGFCKKLIGNERYYSREDIQKMSAIFGYDVFTHSGGWYYNPTTEKAEDQCRHYFKSIRAIKKDGKN